MVHLVFNGLLGTTAAHYVFVLQESECITGAGRTGSVWSRAASEESYVFLR